MTVTGNREFAEGCNGLSDHRKVFFKFLRSACEQNG
jgi:hypothetical protein